MYNFVTIEEIQLDTDTVLSNLVAQHFYEKNDFVREGLTRSYIKE